MQIRTRNILRATLWYVYLFWELKIFKNYLKFCSVSLEPMRVLELWNFWCFRYDNIDEEQNSITEECYKVTLLTY